MALPAHRTGTTNSGNVEIFYRAFGRKGATPILINHGLSFMSYDWIEIADRLARGREVAAMDMRGFGESSWSADKKYGVGDFAGDCLALMDHLGWDRAILVGHTHPSAGRGHAAGLLRAGRRARRASARGPARARRRVSAHGHRRGRLSRALRSGPRARIVHS